MLYTVWVQTLDAENAGTSANVKMVLYGDRGTSRELILDHPKVDNFERNTLDRFTLDIQEDIGEIREVRIWHDNKGEKPGWYLGHIDIQQVPGGPYWRAEANKWLAKDKGGIDFKFPVWRHQQSYSPSDGRPSLQTSSSNPKDDDPVVQPQ